MHNHLNLPGIIKYIDKNGQATCTWEGNEYGEKGIQTAKEEFVSQKGNFGEAMFTKIFVKNVLQYLSQNNSNEPEITNRFKNYETD